MTCSWFIFMFWSAASTCSGESFFSASCSRWIERISDWSLIWLRIWCSLLDLLRQLGVQRARLRELLGVLAQLVGHLIDLLLERLLAFQRLLRLLLFLPGHLARAAEVARQLLGLLGQVRRRARRPPGSDRLVPLARHGGEDLRGRREAEEARVGPGRLGPVDGATFTRRSGTRPPRPEEARSRERPRVPHGQPARGALLLVEGLGLFRSAAHRVADQDPLHAVVVGRARDHDRGQVAPDVLDGAGESTATVGGRSGMARISKGPRSTRRPRASSKRRA